MYASTSKLCDLKLLHGYVFEIRQSSHTGADQISHSTELVCSQPLASDFYCNI